MATTFPQLCKLKYKDQCIWFLNGFWEDGTGRNNAENVWAAAKHFAQLDPKGKDGNELNEFDSHRVLEKYDETLSVVKMREALRTIDQDANGKMSAIEYLIWRFKKGVQETVKSPQGDNQEEIEECAAKLNAVLSALADVTAKLEAQRAAKEENEAKLAEQNAAVKAADAIFKELKAAEDAVRAAEEELQAAVDALKAEEDAYASKCNELESKSKDTSIGVVTRNKAANELQQLKAEDPLPLRRAKITAEAKVRPVTKAREAAEAKRIPAEQKKIELEAIQKQLEALQRKLEEAVRQLDAAYAELQQKMEEAEAALQEAKQKGGVAHGALWWMQREMYEADESLPRAKQRFDHSKPMVYTE